MKVSIAQYCRKLDINGGDIEGMTPLHFACKENMKANVQILLDNGAGELIPGNQE